MRICSKLELQNLVGSVDLTRFNNLDLPSLFLRYLMVENIKISIVGSDPYFILCLINGKGFLLNLEKRDMSLILDEEYFKESIKTVTKHIKSSKLNMLCYLKLINLSEWCERE